MNPALPTASRPQHPTLEIVIPVYNEEAALGDLFAALREIFSEKTLRDHQIGKFHCHFVDDGSRDATATMIYAELQAGFPGTLHILSRNFGHQAAVCAGLDATSADLVAVIDADLQDPPELIFKMLEQWRAGFDVIVGTRFRRQEFFLKKIAYWGFYRLLSLLSEVEIPRDAGDFCLMDRKVVETLRKLPETLRFHRGLRAWVGFRQCGIPYSRPKRSKGTTKYSFGLLYKLATDGIASMSTRVLRATQLFTFLFGLLALGLTIYLAFVLLHNRNENPQFIWFLIGSCINTIIGSVTMFALYIFSAYIGRTYLEIKHRPTYLVREKLEGPQ